MKNLDKAIAILLTAVAVLTFHNVNAQTKDASPWRLGIGLETGVGASFETSTTNSKLELGGTVRLQYQSGKNLAFTLTSGYYNIFNTTLYRLSPGGLLTITDQSLGIVPLKAGVKIYFVPKVYLGAEAGAAFETFKGGQMKLDLSPAIGYSMRSIDVSVRYENFSYNSNGYGLAGLRIAYGFGL